MAGNRRKGGALGWNRAVWVAGGFMLVTAVVAKQFIGEPDWIGTLAQTGILLVGVGAASELVSRKTGEAAYRAAIGLAIGSALFLGLMNGAVGIMGSEDNRANLMYGGVLLVGTIGALGVRLKPLGMARVLLATALAQALVTAIAIVWRLGAPSSGPVEIVTINGFFIALFVGSALLFRKAANGRRDRGVG